MSIKMKVQIPYKKYGVITLEFTDVEDIAKSIQVAKRMIENERDLEEDTPKPRKEFNGNDKAYYKSGKEAKTKDGKHISNKEYKFYLENKSKFNDKPLWEVDSKLLQDNSTETETEQDGLPWDLTI